MTSSPLLLPVFEDDHARGWPKHENAPEIGYVDAAEAFTRSWPSDAHFTAYSVPSVKRRLTLEAIGLLTHGWPMVLLVIDVDHQWKNEKPTTPEAIEAKRNRIEEWWADELNKLAALEAAHPGAFVHRSRSGGYRVIFRLASPFVIWTFDDKEAWRERYRRELLYLARRWGIVGDPACADITRLYRLPLVLSDGVLTSPEPTGDPTAIGEWAHEPSAAELEADIGMARALATLYPKSWRPVLQALAPERGSQEGQAAPELRPDDDDEKRLHKRAAAYLASMAPSVEGAGGNAALWAAALAMVRGFALGPTTALAMLLRDFNPRCSPPWSRSEIERTCRNAADRAERPYGYLRDAEGGEKGLRHKPSERRQPRQNIPHDNHLHDSEETPMPDHDHDQAGEEHGPTSGPQPLGTGLGPLPHIHLNSDLFENVNQAVTALVGWPNIYTRALSLVQVVDTADPEAPDKKGGPVLRTLPRPTLREILAKSAVWLRPDPRSNNWKDTLPSDAVVQGVEARGYWPELRPILGIVQTPFLRRDGTVCERPGYDEASGFALVCREAFPPVPEVPTQEDARQALALVLDLFCDFPFVDAAARHVPVAALLTLLAMPSLGGANTPAFLFEANTPGTGKGLCLDVVCILGTGRGGAKSPWSSDEEMTKVLGAAALEGASLLAFDNISPEIPFGGSAIELVLTCSGQYKPRILGRSESPTLPWRAVVMGTGNNIVVRGDTRRRVLLCTQQTALENPEQREDFKYPELREEAARRRGELVTAALTILRAHALAGRPAAGVRRVGSFEKWAATVASAIAWAGGADVTGAMPRADTSDDPVLSALRVLLEVWPLFAPTGHGLRLGALADKLYPPQTPRQGADEEASDDGLGHVREALELLAPQRGGGRVRFDARKLGYVLRAHRGRNLGGRAFQEGPVNHGSKTWVVIDIKTGMGVRYEEGSFEPLPEEGENQPCGGSRGSGGSFTSDAGAPRAHTRESAPEPAPAGGPPRWAETSPTSPTSPTKGKEEPGQAGSVHTLPPRSGGMSQPGTPANDPPASAPADLAAGAEGEGTDVLL